MSLTVIEFSAQGIPSEDTLMFNGWIEWSETHDCGTREEDLKDHDGRARVKKFPLVVAALAQSCGGSWGARLRQYRARPDKNGVGVRVNVTRLGLGVASPVKITGTRTGEFP